MAALAQQGPHPHANSPGDTSSDEVTGHMYALPLAHDLLAVTDEQRDYTVKLVDQTVSYIVGDKSCYRNIACQ